MKTIIEADLDLHSASEDDEEEMFVRGPAHESENEADEEHEDEEGHEDQDEDEPVVMSKASFMYREPKPASNSQPQPRPSNIPPAGPLPVDDDSVTGEGHRLFALSSIILIFVQSQTQILPRPLALLIKCRRGRPKRP